MSSNISMLQLNMQIMQGALNAGSKISGTQSETTSSKAVYAKEGDAKYDKEMDANEDGTITYDEYMKYCEENAVSQYTENPGKTVVAKVENTGAQIQSIRPINIGKALSTYSHSETAAAEVKIESEV